MPGCAPKKKSLSPQNLYSATMMPPPPPAPDGKAVLQPTPKRGSCGVTGGSHFSHSAAGLRPLTAIALSWPSTTAHPPFQKQCCPHSRATGVKDSSEGFAEAAGAMTLARGGGQSQRAAEHLLGHSLPELLWGQQLGQRSQSFCCLACQPWATVSLITSGALALMFATFIKFRCPPGLFLRLDGENLCLLPRSVLPFPPGPR